MWQARPKLFIRFWLLILIGVFGVLLGYDTWQRVFVMPADEKNPYAYAQTSDDMRRLPARLDELSRNDRLPNPRIACHRR